jgi:hypothetical protein
MMKTMHATTASLLLLSASLLLLGAQETMANMNARPYVIVNPNIRSSAEYSTEFGDDDDLECSMRTSRRANIRRKLNN